MSMGTCGTSGALVFEASQDAGAAPQAGAVRWASCRDTRVRRTEHVVLNTFCFTLGL